MFLDCIGGTQWLTACEDVGVCIPAQLAIYTRLIYNAMMVIAPLVLIVIGMYDLAKAVTSKSAEDIKKAQNMLIKKAIAGAIVFLMFSLVSWMLSILASTSDDKSERGIIKCLDSLFVEEGYPNSQIGADEGFTDGGALCRNYEYDGIMKIYYDDDAGNSHDFVTCYKMIREKIVLLTTGGGTCTYSDALGHSHEYEYYYVIPGKDGARKVCLQRFGDQKNGGAVVIGYGGKYIDGTASDNMEDFVRDFGRAASLGENGCTNDTPCSSTCTSACTDYGLVGEIILVNGQKRCLCFSKKYK